MKLRKTLTLHLAEPLRHHRFRCTPENGAEDFYATVRETFMINYAKTGVIIKVVHPQDEMKRMLSLTSVQPDDTENELVRISSVTYEGYDEIPSGYETTKNVYWPLTLFVPDRKPLHFWRMEAGPHWWKGS